MMPAHHSGFAFLHKPSIKKPAAPFKPRPSPPHAAHRGTLRRAEKTMHRVGTAGLMAGPISNVVSRMPWNGALIFAGWHGSLTIMERGQAGLRVQGTSQ